MEQLARSETEKSRPATTEQAIFPRCIFSEAHCCLTHLVKHSSEMLSKLEISGGERVSCAGPFRGAAESFTKSLLLL